MHSVRNAILLLLVLGTACTESKASQGNESDGSADAHIATDAEDNDSGGDGECRRVGDGCSGSSPDCCPIFGSPVETNGDESCINIATRKVIGCAGIACRGGNGEVGCYAVTDAPGDVTVYVTGSTWDEVLLNASVATCSGENYSASPQCE